MGWITSSGADQPVTGRSTTRYVTGMAPMSFHRILDWQSTATRLSHHENLNLLVGQVEAGAAMQATEIPLAVSRQQAWSSAVDV